MPKKNPRTEAVPSTLQEAAVYFAQPDVALMYFVALRWPDGEITCPTCGSKAVRFIATRKLWRCGGEKHARQQFSVKVGTIMEDSPIGLDKWMLAMWMVTNCKNGVSSYEMARALGITQKSAWFLDHRIRKAMQGDGTVTLGGSGKTVEVDETFIGGKARWMNTRQRDRGTDVGPKGKRPYLRDPGKAIVMGMLERGGKVVAEVVRSRHRTSLVPPILKHVAPKSALHSDELRTYGIFSQWYSPGDYEHKVIDHTVAYVDGNVHTNGIENFWALLKRGIRGTYVSVEPFHLFRYLDEQVFRFNNRKLTDQGRFIALVKSVVDKRLTYKELTGAALAGAQA